jgi:hypothetical protein
MVSREEVLRRRSLRGGFSVAEALVALVLVGVAVLSLGGAANAAARMLLDAALTQGAALEAEVVLDSLADARVRGAGVIVRSPYTLSWTAVDSAGLHRAEILVRYAAGGGARQFGLARLTAFPLARDSSVY